MFAQEILKGGHSRGRNIWANGSCRKSWAVQSMERSSGRLEGDWVAERGRNQGRESEIRLQRLCILSKRLGVLSHRQWGPAYVILESASTLRIESSLAATAGLCHRISATTLSFLSYQGPVFLWGWGPPSPQAHQKCLPMSSIVMRFWQIPRRRVSQDFRPKG